MPGEYDAGSASGGFGSLDFAMTAGTGVYWMAASHQDWNSVTVLSRAEIDAFVADGYVALREAVEPKVAQACQEVIWSELGQRGILREDPSTWTEPVVRISCPEGGPFAEAGTGRLLRAACDQLIGSGRWWQRPGVGGSIPVRFPSESDPGDAGWHIESSYETNGQQRVNMRSRARGLPHDRGHRPRLGRIPLPSIRGRAAHRGHTAAGSRG